MQGGAGRLALVGLGQRQGHSGGGGEQDGAGQDGRASGAEHLPAVQRLHRPEVPNHGPPTVEREVGEGSQLEEERFQVSGGATRF